MKSFIQQFGRFSTVGVLNTVVAVSIQHMAHNYAGMTIAQGGYAGYAVAIIVSYLVNRHWTFQSALTHKRTLPLFIGQSLAGAVVYSQLTDYLATALPYSVAIGIGVVVVFIFNFAMSRLIFSPPKVAR
jgi:putative flippase GtrA